MLAPFGGGNHDPETIRDGNSPPLGSGDSQQQFDTFTNNEALHQEFVGYTFDTLHSFERVVFQEGKNFIDGGWFAHGTLRLQVRSGGIWGPVPADAAVLEPPYPDADYQGGFGPNFETYTFTLTGVVGDGIRLIGDAGGAKRFVSVGELEVWGSDSGGEPPTPPEIPISHDPGRATILATVLAPFGGGNHDPETIRDGLAPPVGSHDSQQQFDTFVDNETPHPEYVGYSFDQPYVFERVVFQEGKNFIDGGWFADGSLRLQVRSGGTWSDLSGAAVSVAPAYPDADYQGGFGPNFETYTFTLAGIEGDGLRLIGDAGGSKRFVSVGELEVYGNVPDGPPDPPDPPATVPAIAHWTFDAGVGGTAFDDSGNLHDGTLVGNAAWSITGQQAGALVFDGAGARVVVPNPGPSFVGDALTLALWVKPDDLVGTQSLVSKDGVWEIEIGRTGLGGQVSLRLNNQIVGGSDSRLKTGTWQHVAATWSRATGQLTYYINGLADGTFSFSQTLGDNAENLGLAARPRYGSNAFQGQLDDVRIYGVALDATTLAGLAADAPDTAVPVARFTASPLSGFAPFDVLLDATGSTDADGRVVDHDWDLGDGTLAQGPVVSHTYGDSGFFEVSLRVTDDQGATDLATLPIAVWSPGGVAITVVNGSGSGSYAAGSPTVLLADPPPAGQIFDAWVGDLAGLATPSLPQSILTVPTGAATITATYRDDDTPATWHGFRPNHLEPSIEYRWNQQANWSSGEVPGVGDSAEVGDDLTLGVHAVVASSGQAVDTLEIAEGPAAADSRLTVRTGGELTVGGGGVIVGKDALGRIQVDGGLFHSEGPVDIGGPWSDARGIVRITAGALVADEAIRIGLGAASPWAGKDCRLVLEGGTVTAHGPITVSSSDGDQPGILRIAGPSTFDADAVLVQRGVLEIDGDEASVAIERLTLESDALLRWSGSAVAPLVVGAIELGPGASLDLGQLELPPGTYTLLDGTSLVDQGVTLAPGTDSALWTLVVDSAAGDLRVTRQP